MHLVTLEQLEQAAPTAPDPIDVWLGEMEVQLELPEVCTLKVAQLFQVPREEELDVATARPFLWGMFPGWVRDQDPGVTAISVRKIPV